MIVQRTFLGGRRWTGPWRIRVDTRAGGSSNLRISNYMHSSSSHPILTDWGDGTHTVSNDTVSHTYASDGDYIISHYSLDNFSTALLLYGGHKNIVEVLDPFPRLPSVGDGFKEAFHDDDYLQTVPPDLFDNNTDFITDLNSVFRGIKGGPLHVPAGLFKRLSRLENIWYTFQGSVLDYIPDGLFEGMTTITNASNTFEKVKASYSGSRIFAGCTGLIDIYYCFVDAEIPVFGDDTFNGCIGVDSTLTFARITSTKHIGARTFANCTSIDDCGNSFTNIPELETIGDYTWQNCTALKGTTHFLVSAPKLKTLPPHTFSGCTKLKNFDYLFSDNGAALGAMDLYLDSCPTGISRYSFESVPDMTATTRRVIHAPSGCTVKSKFPTKYTIVADR